MSGWGRRFRADERAITIDDSIATATLVGLTVLLGLGLGTAVLFADHLEQQPQDANFSFNYLDSNNQLIVTHEQGPALEAGSVEVALIPDDPSADEVSRTWAELAQVDNGSMVGVGDTTQVSEASPLRTPVKSGDVVEVRWTGGDEPVVLETWSD